MSSSNTNGIWKWVRHWSIICVSGSVIYLFLFFIAKGDVHDKTLDLQLHDTYCIIGIFQATVYIVFMLYCIIAFLYQFIAGWKNHVLNVTQIVFTAIVLSFYYLLCVFYWQQIKGLFENAPKHNGWTIYPPLSALTKEIPSPVIPWYNWIFITSLVAIPILYVVYCIFRTIKNYKINET